MKLYSAIVSVTSFVVLAIGLLAPGQAAATSGIQIRNLESGKCMSVKDNVYDNWTPVVQYTCGNDRAEQRYVFLATGQYDSAGWPYYTIRPYYAQHKCVSMANTSTTQGLTVVMWDCQNTPNQYFTWQYLPGTTGGSVFGMKAKSGGGKFLQVNGASHADYAVISQATYFNSAHFKWYQVQP
jgi:hypothetical protein